MSQKGKIRKLEDSDESDSGPDDRGPAKKGKPSNSKKAKGDDGDDSQFTLSRNRFATVREFKGKVMVDIREFYNADGEMKPGKKGIALSVEQWNALCDQIDEISAAVKKMA